MAAEEFPKLSPTCSFVRRFSWRRSPPEPRADPAVCEVQLSRHALLPRRDHRGTGTSYRVWRPEEALGCVTGCCVGLLCPGVPKGDCPQVRCVSHPRLLPPQLARDRDRSQEGRPQAGTGLPGPPLTCLSPSTSAREGHRVPSPRSSGWEGRWECTISSLDSFSPFKVRNCGNHVVLSLHENSSLGFSQAG